jgi:hypothetical protein
MMLPESEHNDWVERVHGAKALGGRGRLADGHRLLLTGLHRAEAALNKGKPWAEGLVARYRLSLIEYDIHYVASGIEWE